MVMVLEFTVEEEIHLNMYCKNERIEPMSDKFIYREKGHIHIFSLLRFAIKGLFVFLL